MKRIIAIIAFLLVVSVASYAQEQSDPQAKKYLDAMAKDFKVIKSAQIDFKLTIDIPEQEQDIQQGSLLQKDDKYVLKTKAQEIYSNGELVWLYNVRDNAVQINNAEEGEDSGFMSPTAIFTSYENGEYIYAITDEPTEGGVKKVQIDFKPVDRNSEYAKMTLYIVKATKKIDRMTIFGKDASRFTMEILDMKKNVKLSDKAFDFDASAYPDVYVEDLRID